MSSKATPHHRLGKDGPSVPAMGLGLMNISHSTYGSLPSDEEKFALLDYAYAKGETFWDTSE
jgi:aryl-alcohol dehydrogenase-like predicted oxidoreductase